MAEFSKEQGSFLQYQLSLKLKNQLMNLSALTGREVRNLLFQLRQEANDASYARILRQYLPIIIQQSGERASLITSKYFEEAEGINAITAGAVIVASSQLSASNNPSAYLRNTNSVDLLIDKKMGNLSYNFNKLWSPELVYDLSPVVDADNLSPKSQSNFISLERIEKSNMNAERKSRILSTLDSDGRIQGFVAGNREIEKRVDIENPIIANIERAPLDYSFIQMEELQKSTPNTTEKMGRVTRGSGSCTFCKHMAIFVGSEGFGKDKFHDHCKCTPGAKFLNEIDYLPDWAQDYQEEYFAEQDRVRVEAKNFEKRRVFFEEFDEAKNKNVRKSKVVWIDKRTGEEGKPPSTSTKSIINNISRKTR